MHAPFPMYRLLLLHLHPSPIICVGDSHHSLVILLVCMLIASIRLPALREAPWMCILLIPYKRPIWRPSTFLQHLITAMFSLYSAEHEPRHVHLMCASCDYISVLYFLPHSDFIDVTKQRDQHPNTPHFNTRSTHLTSSHRIRS